VKGLFRQRRKLQKPGAQPLKFAFGHRVEINTTNTLLDTRALQPTENTENVFG
jgi:hypothetical protein